MRLGVYGSCRTGAKGKVSYRGLRYTSAVTSTIRETSNPNAKLIEAVLLHSQVPEDIAHTLAVSHALIDVHAHFVFAEGW